MWLEWSKVGGMVEMGVEGSTGPVDISQWVMGRLVVGDVTLLGVSHNVTWDIQTQV